MTPAASLAELRLQVAAAAHETGPVMPFGIDLIDAQLASGGLAAHALHEVAAATPALGDAAAASLFASGIAARTQDGSGMVLWALSRFDLYAPGLEQAGLSPDRVLFAEARKDEEVLALAEDGLRHGALGAVIAEVRKVSMTQTRRLQLAAAEGRTPILLLRSWRCRDRSPLDDPSAAMTRWKIACAPSPPLGHPGVGRSRWQVELVRQRNGNPFSTLVEACDAQGCLALPAAPADRALALDRAVARAA